MAATNQIGIYQLENLVLQRVPFTLMDLTTESSILAPFTHLNPYYLNFLKTQVFKTTLEEYKSTEKFQSLSKEAPIVVICNTGKDSHKIATELEASGYINAFYVDGGVASLNSQPTH